ncbi:hypothetical protein SDRG_10915 [Saprolegnia diclina VS20]|uniref:Choline/ethanolamine kinase n=1 Tax=Saprolegnia diclina (strain VS20) TaxID=1156394 RepID=T0RMW3_SAPDV|nr:hypothetical protein SDRG_10915 [Saprolegnia diclina VS20]EQC31312.1 hypothetical protein SDRG_10915 [Saprolegnia diclina VS20]|eukprot:XP_008615153.1 hypothetical protein SDRG_10915 [Saprolegnia diclina VS20]
MHLEITAARIASLAQPESSLRDDIVNVLQTLVPGWAQETAISISQLHGGQSNTMFACLTTNSSVVLRVYGHGLDAFLHRDEEIFIYRALSEQHLGLGLIGTFENGRIETFIAGRPLTAVDLRAPAMFTKVARRFRVFHGVDIAIDRVPRLLDTIDEWLRLAQNVVTPTPVDFDAWTLGWARLQALVRSVPSPIVFCHNDLNCSNIMLSSETNDVVFIDFEYSHYNPRGFDIGNHFAEWCYFMHGPPDEVGDVAMYPSEADQRAFCAAYLKSADEAAIEALRLEANVYALAAHLYWATWAIVQSPKSSPAFDYFAYGIGRWALFQAQEEAVTAAVHASMSTPQ